jgi:cell division protein FtsB
VGPDQGGASAYPEKICLKQTTSCSSGRFIVNLRRLIISVYLLLFLAVGTASAVYFWEAREEYNRLRQLETASRQRLAELEAKLREQEKILERLRTDPVYVEKVIRRRLGYAKPEEFIFRFED